EGATAVQERTQRPRLRAHWPGVTHAAPAGGDHRGRHRPAFAFRRDIRGGSSQSDAGDDATTVNRPAFVTSTAGGLTGTAAATFRRWAEDHAQDFNHSPAL